MKIDASKLRALVKSHGLTNTKLAAQAGITRQSLQSMLKEDHVIEVREKTVKGLAQALRLPDESILSPDPLVGYKDAVADEHADLDCRGLGLPATEPRPMDEVHVPIRVVRMPNREHDGGCQPPTDETEEEPIEEPDELMAAHCLALYRRVLIRGEPGSGKTTSLRHAARACAKGLAVEGRHQKQPCVPLLVRLADFARARERDSEMTLVRFVVTSTLRDGSPDYWTEVEHQIELELTCGACLVLFDGLDEAGGDSSLSAILDKFVDDFGQNQFVLTSRIVGLDAGPWRKPGFATFQIAPWREEDIREFAERWYAARPVSGKKQPKKQLDQRADELTAAILSHPPLREIASNPLMLTILASLHYVNAALPRRRIDLYAKIVEVMLETWEASKREARPGDPLHGIVLEGREFGWLLARLALGMQREGRLLRPRWWVNDLVQQFLRDQMALDGGQVNDQGERVVRCLCERTGLLVERGNGMFGFYHRTFQEYFAAQGLLLEAESGDGIVSLLRPFLFHSQWEEVVVHVAASLPAPRATTLLRIILDDHDPAGRFLRRSQALALRCLVDGAAAADRALLGQVFSDGAVIGASKWLGITIRFISLLKLLRVTRHEAEAQRMLNEIEAGAKRQLPPSEYVTVYSLLHDLPDGPKNGVPGQVCRKRLGGRTVNLIWTDWERRIEDPESWYDKVLAPVRNPATEIERRIVLISFLGEEAESNNEARLTLEGLLVRDRDITIRAACAEALEGALTDTRSAKLLLNRLDKDKSDVVRERCAAALRSIAPNQTEVRDRLATLFTSAPERVRAGAARGLSRLDFTSPDQKAIRELFLATIASPTESSRVRCACIWAMASLLGRDDMSSVTRVAEECLDGPDLNVSRAALHVLADAIAERSQEWPQPFVDKIEAMLMAVPDPCPHLFGDLVLIVAAKENRGSRRVEHLLGDALTPMADRIRIAFIFGSVARQEQVQDSDVDLMLIGDVRLKDVAAALHSLEQTLSRAVNPVLFSPEKFREQYREGNPFLLDIVRKEKIFLKGSRDELTELVADRSPD